VAARGGDLTGDPSGDLSDDQIGTGTRRQTMPGQGGNGGNNANAEERRFLEEHGDRLSSSTRRAKWIHSPDERPDRKGQTLATRSPEVIRAWAEERGGRPAAATRGRDDGRPHVLRLRFTDGGGNLEDIGWDEWLRTFEERDLVFIYQEQKRDGNQSTFFRLDNPRREDG
jgi:hypothetical protein